MSWAEATIHVLDFEGSRRSGVVEYGVVTLARGALAGVRTRLCAPAGEIDAAETAAHGLRARDVADRAPFSDDWEIFTAARAAGPFAAHHAVVERALLRRVWPVPPASPDFAAPDPAHAPRVADWGPWLDTLRLCQRLRPGLPDGSLMSLVEAFGLGGALARLAAEHCPPARRQPHCALHDALAAALVLLHVAPPRGEISLAALLALAAPGPADRQGELAFAD